MGNAWCYCSCNRKLFMPGCPNSLEVDQSLFERNRVLYYFSTLWPVKLNFTKLHSVEILEISSHTYLKKKIRYSNFLLKKPEKYELTWKIFHEIKSLSSNTRFFFMYYVWEAWSLNFEIKFVTITSMSIMINWILANK